MKQTQLGEENSNVPAEFEQERQQLREELRSLLRENHSLRRSEEFLASLITYSRDILTLLTKAGTISYQSPSIVQVLGYEADELIGAVALDFVHAEDRVKVQGCFREALAKPSEAVHLEFRFCKKNKSWAVLEGQMRNLLDNEQVRGVLISAQDVTDRRDAERARLRSEEHYRTLAETASDAIISVDANSTVIYANEATEKITGYAPAELVGNNLSVIMPVHLHQRHFDGMKHYTETGRRRIPWNGVELTALHKNGTEFPVEVSFGEFCQEGEHIFTGIIRDISERKKAEEEVRKALQKEQELSELKTRFVSIMSHEFRTPLSTILSSAEMVEHYWDQWGKEKIHKHIGRIKSTVKVMAEMLDDILLIGRSDAGMLDFNPSVLNVAYFSSEIVEEMKLADQHRHQIVFSPSERHLYAKADERLLRHILHNLLSNALKYSPPESSVVFRLYPENKTLVFTIQDQGIGIPEQDMKFLFEPFHRAGNIGTVPGTGLGLAIVKRAVDLHGGTIEVESRESQGTTFIIRLPLEEGIKP